MFGRRKRQEPPTAGPRPLAADGLTSILDALCPGLDAQGTTGGRTAMGVAGDLVARMLDRRNVTSSPEWSELFALIEVLLTNGAAPPWDGLAPHFLEDLLNAVSHGVVPVTRSQVDERLGPRSRIMAAELDRTWAARPGDSGPKLMDADRLRAAADGELRWIVLRMYRRTPEGMYVGAHDVVGRVAASGGGPAAS